MKRLILSVAFLLALGGSLRGFAQEKAFNIVSDDWQKLQVEFNIGKMTVGEVNLGNETFSTLAIEGYQEPSDNYGSPALPVFSQLVEVPLCEGFDVIVSEAVYDTLPALKHRLMPVQLPRRKSDTSAFKLFINREVYSWNAFVGQHHAEVEAVGVARDRHLARLQFSPMRYNPATGQVIVCRHAVVTVTYRGADRNSSLKMFERYFSPAFVNNAMVMNNLYPKAVRNSAPVRMLIVAHSMFRGQLDTFVNWKRRKGFITDIVYTDNPSVGTTTTSIQNYIRGQYTNATTESPAPTYLLLVGDVQQIPAFDGQAGSSSHITDLYYTSWTTGDIIPDCYCGRFSAQNVNQLTPQILKTLMYEQYTFADPTFLDRAVMVAGVDGGNSGDYGYTHADPAMDYAITNYINGAHGWSQVRYFKNNTSIVPSGVTNVTVGSSSDGNSATVRTYYNQGAGWINYSAHGGSTGWGTPNFGNSHVNQMTNNQKFGILIGNCCQTNMYGESECFGEALLRKGEYAGAVGYIGGSDYTYWGEDFYWAVGVRSGIGPTMSMAYNASNLGAYDRLCHTHNENYSNWVASQGAIMMAGNQAVQASSSSLKNYYWEIYHLMGDPSVMIYLTQADTMNVSYTQAIVYGTTSLTVTAVPYAYVALTDTATHTLYAAAYANASGQATLSLPTALPVGTYELAVSAQQYRTAFRYLQVIQPTGAFPMVSSITPTLSLAAGTTVPLSVTVENLGTVAANGVTVTISSSNPMLTLNGSMVSIPSLPAGGQIVLDTVFYATVSPLATDNMAATINTTATWNGSTMPSASIINLTIKAPVVNLSASSNMLSMLPGSNTSVTLTLNNSGHAAMPASNLRLVSPTPLVTVTSSSSTPVSLNPGATVSRTYTIHANSQVPAGITLPMAITLDGASSIDATLDVFIGTPYLETFEGNNYDLSGWTPSAAYPWSIVSYDGAYGTYCARSSSNVTHNNTSELSITRTVTMADSISFRYKVSSEGNYDKFHFMIDNTDMLTASGEVDWTRASFPVTAGSHTFKFTYTKDYSVSSGSDCAWVDNVALPHNSHNTVIIFDTLCGGDTAGLPLVTTGSGETVTLHNYTVLHPSETFDTASACDSYTWRGNVYTTSFDTTVVLGSVGNCDSTLHLVVNIHPSMVDHETINACDSYTLDGVEYTTSTVLGYSLTSVFGCDSIYNLQLNIYSSVTDTITANTLALNYVWNDSVYTESGTYEQQFSTIHGCDSTVTLILTFGHPGTEGIDGVMADAIAVYPSPTTGKVNFSAMVDDVKVMDAAGRQVGSYSHVNAIDLSPLAKGVYMLRLTNAGGSATCRILLQ